VASEEQYDMSVDAEEVMPMDTKEDDQQFEVPAVSD
jgi:hypothetical protein